MVEYEIYCDTDSISAQGSMDQRFMLNPCKSILCLISFQIKCLRDRWDVYSCMYYNYGEFMFTSKAKY